jgi:hypothetical protein
LAWLRLLPVRRVLFPGSRVVSCSHVPVCAAAAHGASKQCEI